MRPAPSNGRVHRAPPCRRLRATYTFMENLLLTLSSLLLWLWLLLLLFWFWMWLVDSVSDCILFCKMFDVSYQLNWKWPTIKIPWDCWLGRQRPTFSYIYIVIAHYKLMHTQKVHRHHKNVFVAIGVLHMCVQANIK